MIATCSTLFLFNSIVIYIRLLKPFLESNDTNIINTIDDNMNHDGNGNGDDNGNNDRVEVKADGASIVDGNVGNIADSSTQNISPGVSVEEVEGHNNKSNEQI